MNFRVVFLLITLINSIEAIKFNRPRILLPIFDEVRVNFTLEVKDDGCFDFSLSSAGPPLIQIETIYEQEFCSNKVLISTLNRQDKTGKKTEFVLARNLKTDETARVDVILDRIHKIIVHTTTRELYLEDAPEIFELKAQDEQGNDFSVLEGVKFDWKIDRQQILRFLTFSESKYHQVPKEIEYFESIGKKGHMILLDGLKSGTAKVTVHLPYPEYENVKEVQVDIAVLANLIIDPMDANILVDDSIKFKVLQLKQGKLHEIVLNEQYTLEIEKNAIADMSDGLAKGLKLGTTSVILKDKNILDPKAQMPLPKAQLRVVEADKIVINLLPYYNWVTVEQENHEIAVDLYSNDDHKITLGSKYKIDSTFDATLFKDSLRNTNGSRIHGKTLKTGVNRVTAKFGKNLVAHSDMIILGKISLSPKRSIVPYDINNPVNQRIQFNAEGGDGVFIFSNNNTNALQISQTGLAETRFNRGKNLENSMILVKAALAKNVKLYKTAEVLFYPPVKLEIVGYSDTAVNDYVDLHIALYAQPDDGDLIPFSNCENVQFAVEFSNQIFTIFASDYETDKVADACRVIRLKAEYVGSTQVTVSYKFYNNQPLKDEVTSVVYEPVIPISPVSNIVVLPIGSSRNVIYQHGPKKNFNMHSELVRNVRFSSDIASVKEIQASFLENRFGIEVLCKKVGDTKVRVEIFNQINNPSFLKKSAVIETIVHCVKPRFIKLISTEKLLTTCPIDHNMMIHMRTNQKDLEIGIEIQDQQMRTLQNISSLIIDFAIFSQSADFKKSAEAEFHRESETGEIDGIAIPGRDLARTTLVDISTSQKIKATVTDYNAKILRSLNIVSENPVFGISKPENPNDFVTPKIESELDLFFFNTSPLAVTSISVFLSKSDFRLKLKQGSGYYDVKVQDPTIVEVKFDKSTAELIITPKKVGDTFIEIHEKCLEADAAKLSVSVVTFGHIELLSPNRVEKTKTIEAIAKFYDTHDELIDFDYNNIRVYEITEKVNNENIKISMDRDFTGLKRGEIKYVIHGNALGDSKVTIFAGNQLISSTPSNIQVFSPIRLYPRNATILVGSSLEVSYRGGPSHRDENEEGNIVYTISNVEIANIDGNVVEGLKVGKTRVTGKLITVDPNGKQIIQSEDQIIVNVIPLTQINIRAPLRNLKSGNEIPLTLWAEDVSPMVLGTLKNFEIKWNNESPDVVDLTHVFESLGVIYSDKDSIAMRLRGRKPGRAKVSASVTYGKNIKLSTSIDIAVFEGLELNSPKRIVHNPIIIPPKTSIALKVNLDKTIFEINDSHFGQSPVINVTRDGVVSSFDAIGTGLVVATCMNEGQKLDIPIEVKQIRYIMASVDPKLKLKEVHSTLPKNLHLLISVSVYDDLGNKFSHNIEDDILLELSKSKRASTLIHVKENSSFSVELSHEGTDIVAVTLKDSAGMKYKDDYIKLSIQETGMFNRQIQATLGDVICFESPLKNGYQWKSGNSELLYLKGSVGYVQGVLNGENQKVIVRHGASSDFFMKYEINLNYPDHLQFEKKTDIFNGQSYRALFTMSNHYQESMKKQRALITNNLTACENLLEDFEVDFVTCRLSTHDGLFKTRAIFDHSAGSYACEIQALVTLDEITSLSRSKAIGFQLEAQLTSGIKDKVELKLNPAIQIFPSNFDFEKLHKQELVITGMENILQKIELNSSHPDNLILIPLPKTTSGKQSYKLRLNDASIVDDELFISINSPLTQQSIKIPVLPESYSEKLVNYSESWITNIMSNVGKIIAIFVLVLTTIALVLMCQRNRELDTSGVFQTSNRIPQNPSPTQNQNVQCPTPFQGNSSLFRSTSPIKLSSSGQLPEAPIYGDTELSTPFRRYHKRAL